MEHIRRSPEPVESGRSPSYCLLTEGLTYGSRGLPQGERRILLDYGPVLCAMMIDGTARLACMAPVALGEETAIEPLDGFPVFGLKVTPVPR